MGVPASLPTVILGAHVPVRNPAREAERRGAEAVQVFLSNPRGWRAPCRGAQDAPLGGDLPLWVHAPYLVNVATTRREVRDKSLVLLQQTCEAAAAVGAEAVVVHGGSLPDGADVEVGLSNWRRALEGLDTNVPVLIENTAGGSNALARHFDTLARLWEALEGVEVPLGVCLDTCHVHAAGEPLQGAVGRVRAITGRIDLVHLNDSRDAAGSGRDRHQNLGKGTIDPHLLVGVVSEAGAPVILETPGQAEDQAADIAWIRERL